MEKVVHICVGGHDFATYASTLARWPDSLLGTMFAGDAASGVERREGAGVLRSDATPFFDRNPVAFAAVLEGYRTGELVVPASMPLAQFARELDFWQVPQRADHDCGPARRVREAAVAAAERRAEPALGRAEEVCLRACEQAGAEGCQTVKCDFLKGHSYLRASAGVDKTHPSRFHVNTVDKALVALLRDAASAALLLRRLRRAGFEVTMAAIGSSAKSFCLHFQLF